MEVELLKYFNFKWEYNSSIEQIYLNNEWKCWYNFDIFQDDFIGIQI